MSFSIFFKILVFQQDMDTVYIDLHPILSLSSQNVNIINNSAQEHSNGAERGSYEGI